MYTEEQMIDLLLRGSKEPPMQCFHCGRANATRGWVSRRYRVRKVEIPLSARKGDEANPVHTVHRISQHASILP